jgi:2'-hydroxyisoflavone reductase
MLVSVQAAIDTGLTYRPLALTARDTLEWDKTRPAEERANRRFGWSRKREREVLDAWQAEQGSGQ